MYAGKGISHEKRNECGNGGGVGLVHWFYRNPNHHYDLFVSDNFSESQANMIIASATEWQTQTGQFITFSGTSFDGGPETISVYAAPNGMTLDQDCGGDSNVIGCEYNESIPSKIFIDTSLSDGLFAMTSLHELGHSIGLRHTLSGIMCASAQCASPVVECIDVQQICSVWGGNCDAASMPPCASPQ